MATEHLPIKALGDSFLDAVRAIEETDENRMFIQSALMRATELQMLLALAQEKQWPFRKELSPLSKEINDYFVAIEKRLNVPLPDTLTEEELEAEVVRRDDVSANLDGARIVAVSLLAHLSLAIMATKPETPNLKAV